MNRDQKIDTTSQSGQASSAPRSNSRRRLLQAGVSASPVVLSLVSQPVRAITGQKVCRSASAFASFNAAAVNTGATPNVSATCSGNGPVTWRSAVGGDTSYLAANVQTALAKPFAAGVSYTVNKPGATPADPVVPISNPTVLEVLKYGVVPPAGSAVDQLAMNIAAAYLNVASTATPATVMDEGKLATIWANCRVAGGLYPVTSSGPNWDAAAANVWLTSTFVGA